MLHLLNIDFRRVGAISFLKVGRLTLSWSVSRAYAPIGSKRPTAA